MSENEETRKPTIEVPQPAKSESTNPSIERLKPKGSELKSESSERPKATLPEIQSAIEQARERSKEPGRFNTGDKTPIFYSGKASPSERYSAMVGKPIDQPIRSRELALQHAKDDPRSATIYQTPGGKELGEIDNMIEEADLSSAQKDELRAKMQPLWEDASDRYADAASRKRASVGYTENAIPESVVSRIELPRLEQDDKHIHINNEKPTDGRPSEREKVPAHLLNNGRFFTD